MRRGSQYQPAFSKISQDAILTGRANNNKGFFSNDKHYEYLDEEDEDLQDDNYVHNRNEPEFEMSEGNSPNKHYELDDDILNEF